MPKNSKETTETNNENKEIEIATEGSISIQYESFRKMLSHTLRFANESKEENQQVFGVCIGEYLQDKKSYIVKDAIPIGHGDAIELGWSQEIHESIETVKSEYKDVSNLIIGWYHSHLGYGLYFSNSDKVNNLYFQNSENPYGFGIVIEQTLLHEDPNFGVEAYRLKDFSKGAESEFIKVESKIDPPNSIQFFKWVQELVESIQNKNSEIIYEFDELTKPSPEILQEIPSSGNDEEEIEDKEEFSLLYGVNDGMEKLSDSFLKTYEQQLTLWMKDISDDVLNGSEYIRSSINNIKTTLSSGLDDAQRIFDRIFSEISSLFIKNIHTSVDTRLNNQIDLKKSIETITEEQLNNLFKRLEKEIRDITNILEENITNIKNDLETIAQTNRSILKSLNQNNEMLHTVYEETDTLSETIIHHIEDSSKGFESKLFNELEEFSSNMSPNKEIYGEIEQLIERLQKVISDLRQIK
ncbi:MAG: hypothetical protein EU531_02195 [Promethearchaeota archaeon]|nr:MAG: hypothetical protein EU531_02195 [Candidatus Lokiarchaeota archaeon]